MSLFLRVLLIVVSLLTGYYVLRKIRRFQLQIEDSIFWIMFSFGIAILSIFPTFAINVASFIGIESPSNFVFLAFIFILLIKVFMLSIKISQIEHKLITLTQEYAIYKNKIESSSKDY